MKHTALLLLGLALLPHAVQADQTAVSVCVEALEQLATLQTAAPVYKLTGGQERQYLADADRPVEAARLTTIVAESCSAADIYIESDMGFPGETGRDLPDADSPGFVVLNGRFGGKDRAVGGPTPGGTQLAPSFS